ncbi:MAG: hypothetical protein N3B21_11490 [Clostridia bacterium]|nr:hypothetical protein [Clostridia bacterium]
MADERGFGFGCGNDFIWIIILIIIFLCLCPGFFGGFGGCGYGCKD